MDRRRLCRSRSPKVRTGLISGPLSRKEGLGSMEKVDWEREENLEVGSRQNWEPIKTISAQEQD